MYKRIKVHKKSLHCTFTFRQSVYLNIIKCLLPLCFLLKSSTNLSKTISHIKSMVLNNQSIQLHIFLCSKYVNLKNKLILYELCFSNQYRLMEFHYGDPSNLLTFTKSKHSNLNTSAKSSKFHTMPQMIPSTKISQFSPLNIMTKSFTSAFI